MDWLQPDQHENPPSLETEIQGLDVTTLHALKALSFRIRSLVRCISTLQCHFLLRPLRSSSVTGHLSKLFELLGQRNPGGPFATSSISP